MISENVLKEIKRRRIEESKLYDNYIKYSKEGEFVKASEFLWGAINNIVYSIGLLYGKKLGKHKLIIETIKELARKYRKKEYERYAYSADAIHSNFYHAWMSKEDFMEKVREVEELRKWLIELLEQEISRLSQNKY